MVDTVEVDSFHLEEEEEEAIIGLKEEEYEEDQQDPLFGLPDASSRGILGIESVYNHEGAPPNTRSPFGTELILGCSTCNVGFPSETKFIQHFEQEEIETDTQASSSNRNHDNNPTSLNPLRVQSSKAPLDEPRGSDRPIQRRGPYANESEEDRKIRLVRNAAIRRLRIKNNETAEHRRARLDRAADAIRLKRSTETEEERQERLQRQREPRRLRERERRLKKLTEFKKLRLGIDETEEEFGKRVEIWKVRRVNESEEEHQQRLARTTGSTRTHLVKEIKEIERQRLLAKQIHRQQKAEEKRQRKLEFLSARAKKKEQQRQARRDLKLHRRQRKPNTTTTTQMKDSPAQQLLNIESITENRDSTTSTFQTPENHKIHLGILSKSQDLPPAPPAKASKFIKARLTNWRTQVLKTAARECVICHKSVPLRYMKLHLNYHAELEHQKRKTKGEPSTNLESETVTASFSCSSCPCSFTADYLLDMHVKQVHAEPKLNCSICNRNFKDVATLKKHNQKLHSPHSPL